MLAQRHGVSRVTVGKWRRRFHHQGVAGLHDEQRPGRPRTHDDEQVAAVSNAAWQSPPANGTHWSIHALAAHTGISKSTMHRVPVVQPATPWPPPFKISNNPYFVDQVQDIVVLSLNPPDHVVVLWVNEKTQSQALERTQPMLPLGLGTVEGVTQDMIGNGSIRLFAALDEATGKVLAECKRRPRPARVFLLPPKH